MGSSRFGFRFGHVSATLGAAVVAVAWAVVDLAGGVDPNLVGRGSGSLLRGGLEGLALGGLGVGGESGAAENRASKGERSVQRPKLHADVSYGEVQAGPDAAMVAGVCGGAGEKQIQGSLHYGS